jgi:hypothetical protein
MKEEFLIQTKKIMKFREALGNFFQHARFPKLDFFSTLLQFCHKQKILSQMYPEIIGSAH